MNERDFDQLVASVKQAGAIKRGKMKRGRRVQMDPAERNFVEMMFRIRRYKVVPGKTESFNDFFRTRLFPVQKRHGARLVGRFQTDDGLQIVAVWVYQSFDHYEEVQSLVAEDADSIAARDYRRQVLDPLFTETDESFMTSTVPMALTELSHLEA